MKMNRFNFAFWLVFIAISVSASGCRQSSWVNNVAVSNSIQGGDHFVQIITTLNTGRVTLMGLQLPVYKDATLIGSVLVTPTINGLSTLTLNIDVDKIMKASVGNLVSTLPNGDAIPIVNASFRSFSIGSAGSEFYSSVSSDLSSAVFGVSLVVPGLTNLANGYPAFAYTPFNFSSVSGEAGIFTGAAQNQSGFAIFSNINLSAITGSRGTMRAAFTPADINSADYSRVQHLLMQLSANKAVLRLK